MKPRTTLILVVLAVLVLFAGWQFGLRTEPPVTTNASASGKLVFPGLADQLQQAKRVEVQHSGTTVAMALNDAKGGKPAQWGLVDHAGYPIQQDKMRALLTGLTELRTTEPRTSDPKEFSRLGVEDPGPAPSNSTLVRVLDGGGKPIAEIILGHRTARTQGNLPDAVYIRHVGDNQSWLAEGNVAADTDSGSWLDRDIINVGHEQIAAIHTENGGDVFDFAYDNGKLAMKSPADHPKLDDDILDGVSRGLESVTAIEVKPAKDEPGKKLGSALYTTTDGLKVAVTVFMDNKDIWAQFGVTGDGKAKVAADADAAKLNGWTYQIGTWLPRAIVPTMNDLKAAAPTPADAGAQAGGVQAGGAAPDAPPAPDAAAPALAAPAPAK